MKKINCFFLFVLSLVIFSCGKTEEAVPDKSRFYFEGGKPSATPFSLYQINNGSGTAYSISFYTKEVGYHIFSDSFYGYGSMVTLDFNASLFKEGATEQEFKVDNLQEGIIEISAGSLWEDHNFSSGKYGTITRVAGGSLTVWKYKDRYKLNYKITLENNSVVEGAFWDGMLIVYK